MLGLAWLIFLFMYVFFNCGVYAIRCIKFKYCILYVFYCFYNISCFLDNCPYGFGDCGLFVSVCGDGVAVETIHNFFSNTCCITLIY